MEKKQFYILRRNKLEPGRTETVYQLVDGYIIDGVGYYHQRANSWVAIELDTGMSSYTCPTLKECKATVRTNQERIRAAKNTKSYKVMIDRLLEYKESKKYEGYL